jgi:hypothetical protein
MKKLFSKILFSIGLLIFLQNQALAQNIFDELKKAGEQLQKEIDKPDAKQKSPASGTQQPVTPKPPSAANPKPPAAAATASPHNFVLFGVKIGEQISNVKTDNKVFTKDSDNPYFKVGAHVIFTPTTKNDLFEQYVLSYGPISKKIFKISGKLKKEYKTNTDCEKDFKDIFKFVAEKNLNENNSVIRRAEETTGQGNYLRVQGYQMIYILKEQMLKSTYDKSQGTTNIEIRLDARCIKYADNKFVGWMELSNTWALNDAITELADLKQQKEKKDFEQKKDSGKLKGL